MPSDDAKAVQGLRWPLAFIAATWQSSRIRRAASTASAARADSPQSPCSGWLNTTPPAPPPCGVICGVCCAPRAAGTEPPSDWRLLL